MSLTDHGGGKRRLFIALGQRLLVAHLLQMDSDDCPSEGLRPLWRVESDLEHDRDSRQHATQHNKLAYRHCPGPSGPVNVSRLHGESAGHCDRGHRHRLRIELACILPR